MKKIINGLPYALCKYCDEFKQHLNDGKVDSRKKKIYTDESLRAWYGKQCPECKNSKIVQFVPKRSCKSIKEDGSICGKPLPAERYFNCTGCIEELESDDDSFAIYA